MGRSSGKEKRVNAGTGSQSRSSIKAEVTLSVSSSGIDKEAKLSLNGAEPQAFSGQMTLPKGTKVRLSSGKASRGWKFSKWEGAPSFSVKTQCIFTIDSDISLIAVYTPKETEEVQVSPDSGHELVDPLGKNRDAVEDRLVEIVKASIFLDGGLSEDESEDLFERLSWAKSFAETDEIIEQSNLSDKTKETLLAITPSVISQTPEGLSEEEALKWLSADMSLIKSAEETIPGAGEAAQMVADSIQNGEKIAVFSDYDIDGVTGGEILSSALKENGADVVEGFASPDDGFGLTKDFVQDAHDKGCSVLLTADCGTASIEAVELAKSLGMKVVVTDHHDIEGDNPADYHLNPKLTMNDEEKALYEKGELDRDFNTGAQLAWKFAGAIHEAAAGDVPDSHFGEPLYLAGLGCRADGGNMLDSENRAFFKNGSIPEGVAEIAKSLGEDTYTDMSDLDTTQRVLNSAKKISEIPIYDSEGNAVGSETFSPDDIRRAIADPDPLVRKEAREKTLRAYDRVGEIEGEINKLARKAAKEDGKALVADDGTIIRESDEKRFATARVEDSSLVGATRTASITLARETRRPAVVFTRVGEDDDGEPLYKFSASPAPGQEAKIGPVQNIQAVKGLVEDIGGHSEVFAGVCRGDKIDEVTDEINSWAENQDGLLPEKAPKRNTSVVWVSERKIDSEAKLKRAERGREMLSPFTESYHEEKNIAPSVSVKAKVTQVLDPEPEHPRTYRATVELADGTTRDVTMQTTLAKTVPIGEELEVALRLTAGKHKIQGFKPVSSI